MSRAPLRARWCVAMLAAAALAALPAQAGQAVFTPEVGLSGATRGDGSLTLLLGQARAFRVQSCGGRQGDGSFRLDQTISFAGEPSRSRSWRIREVAPLRYAGELSDAAGPVAGYSSGRSLFLQYRVKGPLVMRQSLHLMPDGKTIDNIGRITLLGIPVGHLRETIRRTGQHCVP